MADSRSSLVGQMQLDSQHSEICECVLYQYVDHLLFHTVISLLQNKHLALKCIEVKASEYGRMKHADIRMRQEHF